MSNSKPRTNYDKRINDLENALRNYEQHITLLAEQQFKMGLILAAITQKMQEQEQQQRIITVH